MYDVVVIGAGVIGLSSAARLVEAGARVVVLTADDPAETVSRVAAAVWYPTRTEGNPRVLDWAARTFEEFAAQAGRGVPGVVMRPTRMLLRTPATGTPWWAAAVPDFRHTGSELPGVAGEWRFTVPAVEMTPYLDWLLGRLTAGGAVLRRQRVTALTEVAGLAPVVVNATGLGAGALVGDPAVHPVRGRIVLVTNPGLETSVRDETNPGGSTYIHPRSRDVVLGGTFEPYRDDIAPDPEVGRAILRRCTALVPELAEVRVIRQLAGLRPARAGGPRVDEDDAGLPGGGRLIHNYGHGGAGMTLAWGCADEVARIAAQPGAARTDPPVG
ncbi:FAD-dependent oxidoreductase [Micromonospora sp. NPDC049559]|uniref:FAD-dependent oxidoreductase n=1 Tax=Micromonospora sp. NPDC049559 TaxID=3155923 RepID=UPI00343CF774